MFLFFCTFTNTRLGVFPQCKIMSLSSYVSREMDGIGNTMQKKAAELERLAEVLVTGEQLR